MSTMKTRKPLPQRAEKRFYPVADTVCGHCRGRLFFSTATGRVVCRDQREHDKEIEDNDEFLNGTLVRLTAWTYT